uniref:Ion_trans_2 domain-containing protein n=1 Tax=Syphacia muris TaxID=451379 RepID=A0A0N5APN5_9BILA
MIGCEFNVTPGNSFSVENLLRRRWHPMASILYSLSILTTTGYTAASPVSFTGQFVTILYGLFGIPLMFFAAVDIGGFLSDIVLFIYKKLLKTGCTCKSKPERMYKLVTSLALTSNSVIIKRNEKKEKAEESSKKDIDVKGLPLFACASILLIFCMSGGLLYIAAGGERTFVEAFFVTFNLVANLTMAEMPNDLSSILTLLYILIFVIFGLAIISMCGNLAAESLKSLFLRIHYFGIEWKRFNRSDNRLEALLDEIENFRSSHSDGKSIPVQDLIKFVLDHNKDDLDGFSNTRRNTIAFMPQSFGLLRFADETDADDKNKTPDELKDYSSIEQHF